MEPARHTEVILDAVRVAVAAPGEHRLFRAGKLPGLFPSRAGSAAEAAVQALRDGLLETVRTETRGKVVTEWVTATPKAVGFVHEHDSPKSVLRELREVLQATRAGVPVWLDESRQELAALSTRFETRAAAMLDRFDRLADRVEAALRRAEASNPVVGPGVSGVVPWAVAAMEYLDRRRGQCPLPELFAAVLDRHPDLSLIEFHAGLRRLHDARAVRLTTSDDMPEPEYAIVVDGQLMYAAGR